jgi:hypothetical protein
MQHNPGRLRVHIVRIARPRRSRPSAKSETVLPFHIGVMRRARVIIKLETGLNREEILTADNLCVSISGQRKKSCVDVSGFNDALTNQRLWLTIR